MDARLERWWTMLAQARDFVAVDAPQEAVARVRIVVRECEEALAVETEPRAHRAIEQMLHRASEALTEMQEAEQAWRATVRDKERQYLEHEQAELVAPLAEPTTERDREAHEEREARVLGRLRPRVERRADRRAS